MTQIDAIYRDGIFQPLQPVQLADEQRVRLSVELVATGSANAWLSYVHDLHLKFIARNGVLPDSTLDIAADRLR